MKYQQLLSRIGEVINKLEVMGFKKSGIRNLPDLPVQYSKLNWISEDTCTMVAQITFYEDSFLFDKIYKYTDNFEQELFDKLKEIGIE